MYNYVSRSTSGLKTAREARVDRHGRTNVSLLVVMIEYITNQK